MNAKGLIQGKGNIKDSAIISSLTNLQGHLTVSRILAVKTDFVIRRFISKKVQDANHKTFICTDKVRPS